MTESLRSISAQQFQLLPSCPSRDVYLTISFNPGNMWPCGAHGFPLRSAITALLGDLLTGCPNPPAITGVRWGEGVTHVRARAEEAKQKLDWELEPLGSAPGES